MKYPFFASFIVFCLWLMYEIRKSRKNASAASSSFLETESMANATRRKPLDDLDYIYINLDQLPMEEMEDPDLSSCQEILKELSTKTIVNFTGITNTELKLTYGAPNLDLLSEYDQNFETLITTLQKYAQLLFEQSKRSEAASVLEYAIKKGTDIPTSFRLLARIYKELDHKEKISELIPFATDSKISEPRKTELVTFLENMAG